MTKALLYKRRNKNKQRRSSSEPGTSTEDMTLMETIANLKNRMNKDSIDNDVELIKANTKDTPITETSEPNYELDEVPSVKPVEKTYAKSRPKLDDYMYVESSQGLDDTEVAFPKTTRGKKSTPKDSPVPKKKRKVETKEQDSNGDGRQLRSKFVENVDTKDKKDAKEGKRSPRNATEKNARTTKESIENEIITGRTTRKRKFEELAKPVLREKGQNGRNSAKSVENERKIVRAKKVKAEKVKESNVDAEESNSPKRIMTRSRARRMEISLSATEAKAILPDLSFESDRRVNSVESTRSSKSNKSNTKVTAKAKTKKSTSKKKATTSKGKATASKAKGKASKAKKTAPVRDTRSRKVELANVKELSKMVET